MHLWYLSELRWLDLMASDFLHARREKERMSVPRRQLLRNLSFAFGSCFALLQNESANAQKPVQQAGSVPSAAPSDENEPAGTRMEKVAGIGGLFFRAHDPQMLGRWYQTHLGISLVPTNYQESPWQQEAGPTAFCPFPETSNYFGDAHKVWMVNFRVRDLDKMVAQLRAAGIEVKIDPKLYPNGRFARLIDPEGNPIELWQPAKP